MKIIINGDLLQIDQINTLAELLIKLNITGSFAIAVNNKFIPKFLFTKTKIVSGDNIEIVYPMVGG